MAAATAAIFSPSAAAPFSRGGRVRRIENSRPRVSVTAQQRQGEELKRIEADEGLIVSRRWAALVLPMTTAMGGIQVFSRSANAADEGIQCSAGGCGGVQLRTLNGCGLGVAHYPDFVYNAEGGGGSGEAQELADGRTLVRFDPKLLNIPAVSFKTTTLLGLPLPPPLQIEIVPVTLEGYVDRSTGKAELSFLANFNFTIGPFYRAPPLVVNTLLTTETAQGAFRSGKGKRLDSSGACQLVGVAELVPVDDIFLSTFLTLPTDCLAEMAAQISFT